MEVENLNYILVYCITNKNKIIGKLENISKKESLKNIRPKIKKMNQNDEFVKLKNDNNFSILDKDIEEDFSLGDILIEENGIYQIMFKII